MNDLDKSMDIDGNTIYVDPIDYGEVDENFGEDVEEEVEA
jgi:hypothetical protein